MAGELERIFFVGIAGGSASGKSELARTMRALARPGELAVIPLDAYYRAQDHLPMEERIKANYDHPDSFEIDLLVRNLLDLKAGRGFDMPVYDYTQHTRSGASVRIDPSPIVVVEGILTLCYENLREIFDLTYFVEAPHDLRLERRMQRDVRERGRTPDSVIRQWNDTVQAMYVRFCEPSRSLAGVQVDGTGFYVPVAEEMFRMARAGR